MEFDITKIGKGCVKDKFDPRDHRAEIAMRAIPLPEEYDLSDRIKKIEHQGSSSSCVAQAFAYYAEVLDSFETNKGTQLSARDIYSLIHLPEGGAYIREGAKKVVETGVVLEIDATSYLEGKPPTEAFMRSRSDINEEEVQRGYTYLAKSYARVNNKSFDGVKQAIYQNKGCVIGFTGDNAGWKSTAIVKPPKSDDWAHAVYACGFKKINGTEYIKFVNSWGEGWGEKGYGYVGRDYFESGKVLNPWTLIDQSNEYYHVLLKQRNLLVKVVELLKLLIQLSKEKAKIWITKSS